jgi:hypothetical protein
MAGMDLVALKDMSEAKNALTKVIPDAGTREFVLTNLVTDPKTKQYKSKVKKSICIYVYMYTYIHIEFIHVYIYTYSIGI